MARARKEITGENVHAAYYYLLRKGSLPEGARRELEALHPAGLRAHEIKAPEPEDVQQWCDIHLNPEARSRMWSALRQRDYARRHRTVNMALPRKVYLRLALYAEREGLTLAGAVDRLLEDEGG